MAYGKLNTSQVKEIDNKLYQLKTKMIKDAGFVFKSPSKKVTSTELIHELDRQVDLFDPKLRHEINSAKTSLRKKLTHQFLQNSGSDKLKNKKANNKRNNF